jgi:tetratricopeptide (TPR) repeat protein
MEIDRVGSLRGGRWLAWGVAAWLVVLPLAPLGAEEPDPAQTRRIMREVFEALRVLLPASLDEQRFADASLRPELREALGTLARNAGALARHGGPGEGSFAFLSRTLARDAHEIERRFEAGRFEESRFLLHEITEDCIACHSRLPDPDDAPLAASFLDDDAVSTLPLPEQARLAMATRQFERALSAYEQMFASPDHDAGSIDLLGELDDYLEVSLRVKGDFERPARTLAAFAARDDVRPLLREEIGQWVADLRLLGARAPIEGFEAGRALVREAETASEGRPTRALPVRYHAASGTLHRHVATLPEGDRRAAEAWYWLGVIESRVGRSFWLSEAEAYFEAAIRLAPADPIAKDAYARLEEFVMAGYTGSSGEHVPPDVQAWLAELSHLILAATGEDSS